MATLAPAQAGLGLMVKPGLSYGFTVTVMVTCAESVSVSSPCAWQSKAVTVYVVVVAGETDNGLVVPINPVASYHLNVYPLNAIPESGLALIFTLEPWQTT